MKSQVVCLVLVVTVALGGCSKQRKVSFKTYPVKITITQKGQPLADASVTLHPLDPNGRGAQGKTDTTGVATMKSFGEGGAIAEGAMAGKYKVLVSKVLVPATATATEGSDYDAAQTQQAAGDPYASAPKPLLPPKYNSWQQTPFECEVKEGGPNEFTFDITE